MGSTDRYWGCDLELCENGTKMVTFIAKRFAYANSFAVHYPKCSPGEDACNRKQLVFFSTSYVLMEDRAPIAADSRNCPHIIVKEPNGKLTHHFHTPLPIGAEPNWQREPVIDTEDPEASKLSNDHPSAPDLAANGDILHVSYWQPVRNDGGAVAGGFLCLRHRYPGSGSWTPPHNIDVQGNDGMKGDVGNYSSIAVDRLTGQVMIAYLSRVEYIDGVEYPMNNLKLWVADLP